MGRDRYGSTWSGNTYGGFASAPPPAPRRRLPTRVSRKALAGGAAAAVGLGLALGLLARPQIGVMERRPMAAVTAAAAPLPVEVLRPAPIPTRPGKLEVLPPDMAAAARPKPAPRLDLPIQQDETAPEPRYEWRTSPDEAAPPEELDPHELEPLPADEAPNPP